MDSKKQVTGGEKVERINPAAKSSIGYDALRV
jgi:hypothetical protein